MSAPNSPYVRPDAQLQPENIQDVLARLRQLTEPLDGQMDLFADTTETDQQRGKQ